MSKTRHNFIAEMESRRALRQAVKQLRLPGQPKSERLLINLRRESRARAWHRSRPQKILPPFPARQAIANQKLMMSVERHQCFNQPARIDANARKLRIHTEGCIQANRRHRSR